jgi:hypothetical protein
MDTQLALNSRQERRNSQRWFSGKEIRWRIHGGRRIRVGFVTERSLNGITISAADPHLSEPGTILKPADHGAGVRHGFRVAVVRRIHRIQEGDHKIFVEILS